MTGLFDQRPIRPMLCITGEPFNSNDYLFEPKWDGLRIILYLTGSGVELQNRNLRNITSEFPELQRLAENFDCSNAIVDGEAVVIDKNGLPSFQLLQPRFGISDEKQARRLGSTTPVTFVAFDILHLDDEDLVKQPLEVRKARLKRILREGPYLLFSQHVKTHGERYYRLSREKGFEGVVAKKLISEYVPGSRTDAWIKIKGVRTIECVIAGYTSGDGARSTTFGSLVLAAYDKNGDLVHLGNVGGGFSNQALSSLYRTLVKQHRKTPSIKTRVESNSPIVWVNPRLVCEIEYANMTNDNKLRFPRFKRLRTDLDARDVKY